VAREVEKLDKPLHGADCVLMGDVPIGSGLSSSASVEMAALALFEAMGGFTLDAADAASLGQRVENEFLGVASGIMDQFIVRAGKAGHALFLDCRSLRFEHVPIAMDDAVFVIADTGVTRGLAGSAYNMRVRECAEAVAALRATTGQGGAHLRDFSIADLDAARDTMDERIYRRARHVISENARTVDACEALRAGDAQRLGHLFNASDQSLRTDYEVTCPELDAMTAIGRSLPGCFGSRMTGAGFGGCTVHLVDCESTLQFCAGIRQAYVTATGQHAAVVPVSASHGAHALND
jgi:galactokinase